MSTHRSLHSEIVLTLAAVFVAGCASSGPSEEMAIKNAAKATTFQEQVKAGQSLFTLHCAECHGGAGQGEDAPRLVGLQQGALPLDPPHDRKYRKQRFVTVADVADFASQNMPPRNPGSLGKDAYWAILAFDLHANGLDLPQKLTPDVAKATTIPR